MRLGISCSRTAECAYEDDVRRVVDDSEEARRGCLHDHRPASDAKYGARDGSYQSHCDKRTQSSSSAEELNYQIQQITRIAYATEHSVPSETYETGVLRNHGDDRVAVERYSCVDKALHVEEKCDQDVDDVWHRIR